MKKVFFKTMMGASFACMLLTGCVESVKDLYDPNYVIQQYQKNWTDSIGQIDPNQTWNMAKRVTAEIDLTGAALGGSLVNIYTANPLTPSTKLLATATIADYDAIEFDMPKALNYVYVSVQNGSALSGYYRVKDGIVTVAKGMTRAGENVASLGNQIEMGTFQNPLNNWQHEDYPGDFYYLTNVSKSSAAPWRYLDYQPLFGKGGYFAEGTNNYTLYGEKWDVQKDIVYTTAEEGPVEISYSFGSTRCKNMFGYFYFKEEATTAEILNMPKYILMSDAKPTSNITMTNFSNNISYTDDMSLGDWFLYNMLSDGSFQGGDPFVVGSTYKLTYFGEDGKSTGSENFPAGIKIGFFVVTDGMTTAEDQLKYKIWYSMPSLNYETAKVHQVNGVYEPDVITVSYKYGDTNILGFEDNTFGDKDMNDLVFFVAGEFEEDYTPEQEFPVVPPTIDAQEWILACEDLGTTDDFDFNDVVFSVKYVAGETKALVTPLAAGGTLPAKILYNGSAIGQEVHEWFSVDTKTMVNTTNRKSHVAMPIEITVPSDFTMTNNMGGFGIEVNEGKAIILAPNAGAAPQMILVSDANWSWPYERVRISDAYGLFAEWASSSTTNEDWYATPTGKTVDGDYSNSSTGEEGTGGSGSGEGGDNGEGGSGDNTGGSSSDVSEYGTLIAAEDLVSGQLVPAKYFAGVGNVCKLTVIGKYVNIRFRNSNWVYVSLQSNENEISEITLEGALLESAKKGEMYYDCYNVVPVIYVK